MSIACLNSGAWAESIARMPQKELPPKTCSIDRLVRRPELVQAALEGRKTEQRRDGLYAYPGERFTLQGVVFEVVDIRRERLGEMTDADARREGYENLEAYKQAILSIHPGMRWNPEGLVWVHVFRRVDAD